MNNMKRSQSRHLFDWQHRRATTILCVFIVLIIVGLLFSQAVQTLALVRHGDIRRQNLLQASEVIELARLAVAKQQTDTKTMTIVVNDSEDARVTVESLADKNQSRITVRYPYDSAGEVSVSWEGQL